MSSYYSALQLIATIYFSFLFEGLLSLLNGIQKDFKADQEDYLNALNEVWCVNYRIEDLKILPKQITKRRRTVIRICAAVGFVLCFSALMGKKHILYLLPGLSEINFHSTVCLVIFHLLIILPLVICCILLFTTRKSIKSSLQDIVQATKNLATYTESICRPGPLSFETLNDIDKKYPGYKEEFEKQYDLSKSAGDEKRQKIDAAGNTRDFLLKSKIDLVLKSHGL